MLIGVGLLMALPLLTALAFREWAAAVDFLVGLGAALLAGCSLAWLGVGEGRPSWIHGMVTAGISWLAAMAVAAVPYWLSGHYLSYLDCMFDVMSGFTTTGLTLHPGPRPRLDQPQHVARTCSPSSAGRASSCSR